METRFDTAESLDEFATSVNVLLNDFFAIKQRLDFSKVNAGVERTLMQARIDSMESALLEVFVSAEQVARDYRG